MIFKRIQSYLIPFDNDAYELMNSLSDGADVAFDKVISKRNMKFHRKYFALLNFAFEHWESGELSGKQFEGVIPQKSFTRFRKDIVIMAGFFEQEIRITGELRIVAKSISFSNMKEKDFEELYSNTINVILKHILTNYNKGQLDKVVIDLLGFDG